MLKDPYKKAAVNEKSSNKIAAAKHFMETILLYFMISITILITVTKIICKIRDPKPLKPQSQNNSLLWFYELYLKSKNNELERKK